MDYKKKKLESHQTNDVTEKNKLNFIFLSLTTFATNDNLTVIKIQLNFFYLLPSVSPVSQTVIIILTSSSTHQRGPFDGKTSALLF